MHLDMVPEETPEAREEQANSAHAGWRQNLILVILEKYSNHRVALLPCTLYIQMTQCSHLHRFEG